MSCIKVESAVGRLTPRLGRSVGMTGRRGPLKIMNDKCLQIAPGLHHLVAVLVVREWIAADSTACAGVLKHLDNARHWN